MGGSFFSVRLLTMTGSFADLVDGVSTLGVVASWVWMLTTAVLLARRARVETEQVS